MYNIVNVALLLQLKHCDSFTSLSWSSFWLLCICPITWPLLSCNLSWISPGMFDLFSCRAFVPIATFWAVMFAIPVSSSSSVTLRCFRLFFSIACLGTLLLSQTQSPGAWYFLLYSSSLWFFFFGGEQLTAKVPLTWPRCCYSNEVPWLTDQSEQTLPASALDLNFLCIISCSPSEFGTPWFSLHYFTSLRIIPYLYWSRLGNVLLCFNQFYCGNFVSTLLMELA